MSAPLLPGSRIDWEARYYRLAAACEETRQRAASMSEMRLTDFQRETLLSVLGAMNHALADPDGKDFER